MEAQTSPQTKIPKKADFTAIAKKYAKDVLAGKVVAGKWAKLACQRFIDDLDSKRWDFDKEAVGRVCRFAELCPHIKGSKALQTMKLQPWQVFILANIFGFKDKHTGFRRFNRGLVFVARGNGKSFLASVLGIYAAFFDGEHGSDVYSAATTRDQAKIIWATSQAMLRQMPELAKKAGIEVGQQAIFQQKTNSTFKPLSSDYGTLDGLNPYVVLLDETHAITRGLFDILETALSKRDQPLMLSISTAGFDTSSVGYDLYQHGKRVLDKSSNDDRLFFICYESDEEDVLSETAWEQANPNLDVSVIRSSLEAMAKKAASLSSFRNAFVTRHLNRWVSVREAWLNLNRWDECQTNLSLDDFEGRECYIGLDLATRSDITSKCLVFPEYKDGKRHYTCFWTNWLPEIAIQESRNASYGGWALDGHLTPVEGDTIDFNQIRESIVEDCKRFNVREVCFDPWAAAQLAQDLAKEGVQMVEVRPTVKNFSPSMKEMEAAVLDARLHHDGNPAVRWMVGNVTVKPDAAGNIYAAKQKNEQKIDAATALISALTRAMAADVIPSSFKVNWI